MKYLEIEKLKTQFNNYKIKISQGFNHIREDLYYVTLKIGSKSWDILIDDEYGDFGKHNPVFDWFLVLASLDDYDDCEDILEWSNYYGLEPAQLLGYYRSLGTIYKEIETAIGPIDPMISLFNYSLRTGVIKALEDCM